jgi:hypothetical protein
MLKGGDSKETIIKALRRSPASLVDSRDHSEKEGEVEQ